MTEHRPRQPFTGVAVQMLQATALFFPTILG
jgi:hypothetical protein